MTKFKYNDINTNRGIVPDKNGVFSPQKMEICNFFSFFKLENIIKMFQTLFMCLNWDTAYD